MSTIFLSRLLLNPLASSPVAISLSENLFLFINSDDMSFRNPAETHKKGLAQTDSTKMDAFPSVYEERVYPDAGHGGRGR